MKLSGFVSFLSLLLPVLADDSIVGGTPIPITKVPWQVSLQFDGSHFCGGSIIAPGWILTAAHCTEDLTAGQITVRAGTALRGSGGTVAKVARIIQHAQYDTATLDYDIALLQLSSRLTLGSTTAIIPLASAGQDFSVGKSCFVSGWGLTSGDGDVMPGRLQGVQVEVASRATCSSEYGGSTITDRMLCAGANGRDACEGDSGGPLACSGVLAGVVSWGISCADPTYKGVYADVSALRAWIKKQSGI